MEFTVLDNANTPMGPFTRAEVAAKLQSGEIVLTNLAYVDGLSEWTPLAAVLAKVDAKDATSTAALPEPVAIAPAYSYAASMQPPPELVYATFWMRVAAHLLDNIIISIPVVVIWMIVIFGMVGTGAGGAMVAQSQNGKVDPAVMATWVMTIVFLYIGLVLGRFIIAWLYHAMLESGPHQSTYGKRMLGLKVTSITGQRISFGHASGRFFATIVTNMTMFIGYLMVLFTERKQTLHDMLAGTLVVRN